MSQTTGSLCRKIGGAGDLQSAVRRMKVLAASSIRQYDESVRTRGRLPEEKPYLIKGPLRLYFKEAASPVTATLAQFLTQARPGDYLPLVAYIAETPAHQRALQDLRRVLQDRLHIPITLGYGPRFLHSNGQFHKGGPYTCS